MPVNLSSAIFTTFVVIFKEMLKKIILSAVSVFAIVSCTGGSGDLSQWNEEVYVPEYAGGFRILSAEGMQSVIITTSSPWQGASGEERAVFVSRNGESAPDGFKGEVLKGNADRIVCMSSSYIAMLDALGETGKITGVSGMDFISNPDILAKKDRIADVGYDGNIDYERLVAASPDIVLLYGITGASGMEDKLKELGIPFMYIGEYMEESPLGKAEWCVPVAEIIGRRDKGIEVFRKIPQRYDSLKSIASEAEYRPKVMVNIPYGDAWIMSPPGSYIGRLIADAGADYIYPGDTTEVSRTIDIEEAYKLVNECDYWINTGRVATKAALIAELPKFSGMPCLEEGRVYNNNLRLNGRGGDDFWESGIMHPDIILEDLITIFHPGLLDSGRQLYYYRKLE